VPLNCCQFLETYWRYLLVGGIALEFGSMVFTAVRWALARVK
jgi:hypothetical protein